MTIDFKKISPYEQRIKLFEDSEVVCRVDKAKASVLSPKAKDCQRQLNEASSVWAIDGRKFLFVFSDVIEDGRQKVTVWGVKAPGDYQRIKTVWVTCRDYFVEAVVEFLTEYFELFILTNTYSSDVRMLHDIDEKLKEAQRYTHDKLKVKLLKAWVEIMPRFNKEIAALDERIAESMAASAPKAKAKGKMKTFFQDRGATYYLNDAFSVAVRKECIEYYRKLRKGHAVVNVEVYSNFTRISLICGQFIDQLFGKAVMEGIDVDKHPTLCDLIGENNKYTLVNDHKEGQTQSMIVLEIDREFKSWPEAIADPEVNGEIRAMIKFGLALYNELVASPSPTLKALARNFYD